MVAKNRIIVDNVLTTVIVNRLNKSWKEKLINFRDLLLSQISVTVSLRCSYSSSETLAFFFTSHLSCFFLPLFLNSLKKIKKQLLRKRRIWGIWRGIQAVHGLGIGSIPSVQIPKHRNRTINFWANIVYRKEGFCSWEFIHSFENRN